MEKKYLGLLSYYFAVLVLSIPMLFLASCTEKTTTVVNNTTNQGGGGDGGTTTTLTISLQTAASLPLIPLRISTVGLEQGENVSVKFSNDSGYSVTTEPIRVDTDGTVVVGVPLYVDPQTSVITSGSVNIQISQQLTSGTILSATQSFNIQDLPSLTSLGTQLGEVTYAYLIFSALVTQNQITQLEIFEALSNSQVDTASARSALLDLRNKTIQTLSDVAKIMADPSTVISGGSLADGTPIVFDRNSVEVMDRVFAVLLSELPITTSTNTTARSYPASKAVFAVFVNQPGMPLLLTSPQFSVTLVANNLDTIKDVIDHIKTAGGTIDAVNEIQKSDNFLDFAEAMADGMEAVTGAVGSSNFLSKQVSTAIGLLVAGPKAVVDLFLIANALNTAVADYMTGDASDFMSALGEFVNTPALSDMGVQVAKFATGVGTLAGGGLAISGLSLAADLVDWSNNGTFSFISSTVKDVASAVLNQQDLPFGGVQVETQVMNSNGTVSGFPVDISTTDALPFSLQLNTITDGNGQALLPVPTHLLGSSLTNLNLTFSDPLTGADLGATSTNLSGIADGQTVMLSFTIPPPSPPDESQCCIDTNGCPGETGTECAAGCCCCGLGMRCCTDLSGCCSAKALRFGLFDKKFALVTDNALKRSCFIKRGLKLNDRIRYPKDQIRNYLILGGLITQKVNQRNYILIAYRSL